MSELKPLPWDRPLRVHTDRLCRVVMRMQAELIATFALRGEWEVVVSAGYNPEGVKEINTPHGPVRVVSVFGLEHRFELKCS